MGEGAQLEEIRYTKINTLLAVEDEKRKVGLSITYSYYLCRLVLNYAQKNLAYTSDKPMNSTCTSWHKVTGFSMKCLCGMCTKSNIPSEYISRINCLCSCREPTFPIKTALADNNNIFQLYMSTGSTMFIQVTYFDVINVSVASPSGVGWCEEVVIIAVNEP